MAFEAVTAEGQQPNGNLKVTAFHNNNVFYAKRGYAVSRRPASPRTTSTRTGWAPRCRA